MRWRRRWRCLAALVVVVSGCGWFGARKAIEPRIGAEEEGFASWYGPGYEGRQTAAGEVFDSMQLTAAHRSLPFGTRVWVTNLNNGRAVEVRINDRGPFVTGRILDLSYAAARSLGMVEPGVVPVRLRVVGFGSSAPKGGARYVLQLGTFTDRRAAERLLRELRRIEQQGYLVTLRVGGRKYYRVRLAAGQNREVARRQADRLAQAGLAPVLLLERE